jgi:hypothetical protein
MNSGVHVDALVNLAIVLIVVFFPLAPYRRGRRPGRPDSDPGDGWGKGPEPPPTPVTTHPAVSRSTMPHRRAYGCAASGSVCWR